MSTSDEFGWKWIVTCKITSEYLKGVSEKNKEVHSISLRRCDIIRIQLCAKVYKIFSVGILLSL